MNPLHAAADLHLQVVHGGGGLAAKGLQRGGHPPTASIEVTLAARGHDASTYRCWRYSSMISALRSK